jgi:hypothetical protein
MQLKTTERIERYAEMLEKGKEVTASEVCKELGTRGMSSRVVANVFRSGGTMEFVPIHKTGAGKWRRR